MFHLRRPCIFFLNRPFHTLFQRGVLKATMTSPCGRYSYPFNLLLRVFVSLAFLSHSCLLFLTTVMPRGKKSKLRACEKCYQARGQDQGLGDAQATAAGEQVSFVPLTCVWATPPSSPAAGTPQKSQRARASSFPDATISCVSSDKGAKSQREENPSFRRASPYSASSSKDLLARKIGLLVQVFVDKYKMKEPVTKEEMLKIINKEYRAHFTEIFESC